jgi:uncharacterized membrane protein
MKAVRSRLRFVLLPPLRGRTALRAALPLLVFLALVPAAWLGLTAAGVLAFSTWTPLLLLLLAPWVWRVAAASSAGLGRGRARAALWSRFLLLALLATILAEPRAVRSDDRLTVMFALDHSSSVATAATDAALQFALTAVAAKPDADEAGLLFFGRNAAVELPPAMALPFEAINVDVDRDGTGIAAGLSLAAAMLPPGRPGRVVLCSDGVDTEGGLEPVLDALAGRGIAVDVVPLDYRYEHEVWIERLELPAFTKIGEVAEAAVVLSSLQPGRGVLRLLENGAVVFEGPVELAAGKNRFAVPIHLTKPGYFEYAAHVEVPPGSDTWTENNQALSFLYLEGKGSVLLVTDPGGRPDEWQAFARALQQQGREVKTISAFELPREPLALLAVDCIVFADVPRDAVDAVQVQAVHDAVRDQGTGFLMLGAGNAFGPGGWHRTPIEDLLPVGMNLAERKVMPKGALAIVLHTCEFAQGNTWAKRITKQAIDVLDPRDEVGVLLYDWQAGDRWLFPLTVAAEVDRLHRLVNAAEPGDMPGFGPSMQLALAGLQASDAATRHLLVISDGDPVEPPPQLLAEYVAAKVTVSTVAINPHAGRDTQTLQAIAGATGGRFHHARNAGQLPGIFVKEAKTLRRSAVQNRTFVPTVASSSPVLKGIAGLPPLHGYVLTTPKPRATTVLEGPDDEDLDPVLALWRYGVGGTAAFTSDLSPGWGRDWVAWEHYRAFVNQLVAEIVRVRAPSRLALRAFAAGSQGVVLAEDHGDDERPLDLQAVLQGPREQVTLGLQQTGPRRYEARFPLQGRGRYRVTATGAAGGAVQRAHAGFAVPYSHEFLRFRSDPLGLARIVERTGGRMLAAGDAANVFVPDRRPQQTSLPITGLLLLVLACLIPLDVGLRRVHLDRAVLRAWFGRRAPQPTTLEGLLEHKRARREPDRPQAPLPPPPTAPPADAPRPPAVRAAPPPAPRAGDRSAAARLLDAKRRAAPRRPDDPPRGTRP